MQLGLMLTDHCNFQCTHCMVDSKLTDYTLASKDIIDKFIEMISYNKPDKVCIVGGEPLLFLDEVEFIITRVRKYCNDILIYSNGTFLLDEQKRNRVKSLGIQIRISKTDFHKDFWSDNLEQLINESPYWRIEALGEEIYVHPRGRALTNGIYKNTYCQCSLVTNEYNAFRHSNRMLVMPDGTVNIWCPCMSLELANVFTDSTITHDLLVQREQALRGYLLSHNLLHKDMLFMCNEICNKFRVTKDGIYRGSSLVEEFR